MPPIKPKPVVFESIKQGRGTIEMKANLAGKKGGGCRGWERSTGNGWSIYEAKYEP